MEQQIQYLKIKEIANEARVSEATVRKWIKNGTLQAIRIGDNFRVPAGEWERLKEAAATTPEQARG